MDPNSKGHCIARNVLSRRQGGGRHSLHLMKSWLVQLGVEPYPSKRDLDLIAATNDVKIINYKADMEIGHNSVDHAMVMFIAEFKLGTLVKHITEYSVLVLRAYSDF